MQRLRIACDALERRDDERGQEERRAVDLPGVGLQKFPADEADGLTPAQARISEDGFEARRPCSILTEQAEGLAENKLKSLKPGARGVVVAFIADDEELAPLRPRQEQRLLEARIEAGEKGYVGDVLAIGIDRQPVATGLRIGRPAALLIGRRGN